MMPRPTLSQVHVDRSLTNISVAHFQTAENFASMRVFPRVPVENRSDTYFEFSRADFNRDEARKRAPGTESAGNGYGLTTQSYVCDVWAYHKDVADQTVANSDTPLRPFENASTFVTHKILIRKENDWANRFFTAGVWTGEEDGSGPNFTQWSDGANSDPIKDMRRGASEMKRATGLTPNKLTLGWDTFTTLLDHPDIVDRVKFSGGVGNASPAMVNERTIAQILGLDEVIVSGAVQNTSDQGAAEDSKFILGKNALLTHSPQSAGIETPAAGYTFAWRGFMGNVNDFGFAIKRFRMEEREAERVEGQGAWDHKVVSPDLGYFFANAIA